MGDLAEASTGFEIYRKFSAASPEAKSTLSPESPEVWSVTAE
jgi:hypothetical protein